jgi:hypothetical protein
MKYKKSQFGERLCQKRNFFPLTPHLLTLQAHHHPSATVIKKSQGGKSRGGGNFLVRLRLAMQVSTGIAAQTPRRWETSPRRGHLPGLAQMRIWQNRDGIETSPLPADPRVFPATPSHAGNKKRYARVSSIFLSRPLSLALPRGAAAASPSRFLAAPPVS